MATTTTNVFYCTYRNRDTNGQWRRSREYKSVADLMAAMTQYLTKFPSTTVTFQFRTIYQGQP